MPTVQYSIVIARPIKEVFDFATDLATISQWQPAVLRSEFVEKGPPMQSGSRVVETRRMMGREVKTPWEVTEYAPPFKRGFKITNSPMVAEGLWSFAEVEGGTQLNFVAHFQGRGLFRLAMPLLVSSIRKSTARDFDTLKQILEKQCRKLPAA